MDGQCGHNDHVPSGSCSIVIVATLPTPSYMDAKVLVYYNFLDFQCKPAV